MRIVVIFGWNVGFQKVAFTKMLKSKLGYSLSESKAATDAVLDNQRIELHVQDSDLSEMLSRLNELGAKFVLEN